MANPYVKVGPFNEDAAPALGPSLLNDMDQGIHDAHFQPVVRSTHSGAQSLTSGVDTALNFDSDRKDTHNMHTAGVPTRFICQVAGFYLMGGCVSFTNGTAGLRILRIRLDGTTDIAVELDGPPGTASPYTMGIMTGYDLAVNQYVELLARQDSGGTLSALKVGNYSPEFWMARQG